ncbi:DUF1624 domain-containing protein [Candidatus Sumerlaeota bacterium]|nr:DUF1624 domain-containing protein [Candidatus Sumerlaeota bacterium]
MTDATSTAPAEAPAKKKERIESLDAFRGFTILGMVFVIAVAAGGYQNEPYHDMPYGGLPQQMRWFGSPPVSTWFHAEVGWDLWHENFHRMAIAERGYTEDEFNHLTREERAAISAEIQGEMEAHEHYPLRHIGCTFTDLIAPWFVFIVGVCIPLSRRKRGAAFWKHALSRTLMLILMGMLYISFVLRELAPWWGVLQAIGVAYLCGVLLTLLPSAGRWITVFAVSIVYLLLTELWPAWTQNPHWFPEWTGQVWAEIDRPFWTFVNPTGSEKRLLVIHCLPWLSISYGVMTMIGVLVGEVIREGGRQAFVRRSLIVSAIFIPIGYGIHRYGLMTEDWSLCMNKPEVTISYALFTAGLGALVLLGFFLVIDVWRIRFWSKPLLVFGMNPLLAYFMMILMRRWIFDALGLTGIFDRVYPLRDDWGNPLVHNWAMCLEGWGIAPESVAEFFRKSGYHGIMWGLIWTLCLWLIVRWFNRREIFWKL